MPHIHITATKNGGIYAGPVQGNPDFGIKKNFFCGCRNTSWSLESEIPKKSGIGTHWRGIVDLKCWIKNPWLPCISLCGEIIYGPDTQVIMVFLADAQIHKFCVLQMIWNCIMKLSSAIPRTLIQRKHKILWSSP